MCNRINFTDICLELSSIIILAKYDTLFLHILTELLNRTICTQVALWIAIHENFFPVRLCQPMDQRSVVEHHRGNIRKKRRKK